MRACGLDGKRRVKFTWQSTQALLPTKVAPSTPGTETMGRSRLEQEASANPIDASPNTRATGRARPTRAGNRDPSIYVFASDFTAQKLPQRTSPAPVYCQ